MFEILETDLSRIGEVEYPSSDNHSIHWQKSGTLTLIAMGTENNLVRLKSDRFILIRDDYRQGGRLDGLYLICNVAHEEERNEITVNGKSAFFLLRQRAVGSLVLSGTTAGAALSVLVNDNLRGLPIQTDSLSDQDPAVIRYPMDGGAVDELSSGLMEYCGIGMESVLDGEKVLIRFNAGRDLSAMAGVPALGIQSGWARNASFSIDSSDFCNVVSGVLIFEDGHEESFSFGDESLIGSARRELYIGEISQKSGETDEEFLERANTQAAATLANHLLRITISADISPADYGRPFLVGDLVRVQVGPVTLKKRIAAATWLHDQSNDKITLTLGDQLNTVPAEIREQAKAASARAGGAAKSAAEAKKRLDGIETDFKILAAEVTDIIAGMDAYVLNKTFEDYKLAVARLFAEIQEDGENVKSQLTLQAASIDGLQEASAKLETSVEGAEARIDLNAQNINGVASSVASIEADVVELKGRVDVTGTLSISDGRLRCEKSIYTPANVFANKFWSDSAEIRLGSNDYVPTEITSTAGPVLVLGIA